MKYITPLNTKRVKSYNNEPSQTKQEFKDDCDPTKILQRFQQTGLLEHANQYQPQFGIQSSMSYHEAKQLTAESETMFQDLPSATRARFNQNVGEYLDFVSDPSNVLDMLDDGKINASSTPKNKEETPPKITEPSEEAQSST